MIGLTFWQVFALGVVLAGVVVGVLAVVLPILGLTADDLWLLWPALCAAVWAAEHAWSWRRP